MLGDCFEGLGCSVAVFEVALGTLVDVLDGLAVGLEVLIVVDASREGDGREGGRSPLA